MAIRAPNLALRDLSQNPLPAPAPICQGRDVSKLVADVVELQHDNVRLTAIDARMVREIRDEFLLDKDSLFGDLSNEPSLLPLMVLPIVLGVRLSEARAAPRLQLRLAAPDRWERVKRLQLAAFRARSHERERADTSTPRE